MNIQTLIIYEQLQLYDYINVNNLNKRVSIIRTLGNEKAFTPFDVSTREYLCIMTNEDNRGKNRSYFNYVTAH